ncbi:MAG: hypothetical protein ACXWDH_06380 [Aeromicrobium sp.]
MFIIDFLMTNQDSILAFLSAAHAFALAIVNLTPTPTDNALLARIYGYVEIVAGLWTRKAKE